jgi:hypothetical protein
MDEYLLTAKMPAYLEVIQYILLVTDSTVWIYLLLLLSMGPSAFAPDAPQP